ncbi:MAG: thioredoxin family protein [Planctomycetota bacterium]
MDIMPIILSVGYVLSGVGAGYLASILVCRLAATKMARSGSRMALLGGLVGVCVAAGVALAAPKYAPELTPLVTMTQFDQALARSGGTPVVVSFYADWCAPSRAMSPQLRQLQRKWDGRILFYKVNVDESPELKDRFAVRSIPTLVYFQGEQEADRTIGMVSEGQIESRLARLVQTADAAGRAGESALPVLER